MAESSSGALARCPYGPESGWSLERRLREMRGRLFWRAKQSKSDKRVAEILEPVDLLAEAADEIERLRELLDAPRDVPLDPAKLAAAQASHDAVKAMFR